MSLIIKNYFIPKKLFLEIEDFIIISKGGAIPINCEKIALSFESPKLNEKCFQVQLTHIVFYNIKFVLSSENIPDTIKILGFKGYKNQITKEFVKPSVKLLGIGGNMGYPLDKELLEVNTIKKLFFDGNYSHPITTQSIIDNLDHLYLFKTKFPFDENSLPSVIPKNINFCQFYKFPIIGKTLPNIPTSSNIIHFINIANNFRNLSLHYRINIGWGYRHKLKENIVDDYRRSINIGNVVQQVSEKLFLTKVDLINGYPHKIIPISNTESIYDLEFGNIKYPVTKEIIPSKGRNYLTFKKGYQFKLTPDLFENVKSLETPFDISYFPINSIERMVLFDVSQVISANQLPRSLSSLTLIDIKVDPNLIKDLFPDNINSILIGETINPFTIEM
ncbi:hypothetical protein ACTA71_006160 [Dictyostelium dimigraforme]